MSDLDSVLERIQAVPTAERAVMEAAESARDSYDANAWGNAIDALIAAVDRLREARGK